MGVKKRVIVGVFITLAIFVLIGYGMSVIPPQKALNDFSKLIENEGADDLTLTIYYVNPDIFPFFPWSIDDLKRWCYEKITINGNDLEEHTGLFKQISSVRLMPVLKKSSCVDARLYYVFETEEKGKIFDVAMWGYNGGGILINGFEVKLDNYFYDIVMPFLPEDIAEKFDAWRP